MSNVVWFVLMILAFLIGIGGGFWLAWARGNTKRSRLAEVEAQLDDYKARVTEHFTQSALHFQAIGRQYRGLYEHMAAGSRDLCEPVESEHNLQFPLPGAVAAVEQGEQVSSEAAAEAGPRRTLADSAEKKPAQELTTAQEVEVGSPGEQPSEAGEKVPVELSAAAMEPSTPPLEPAATSPQPESEERLVH